MIPSDLAARLRLLADASFLTADQPLRAPTRVRAVPDVLQAGRIRTDAEAAPALSGIGRLISSLLARRPAAEPAILADGRPLLAALPAGAASLAQALREAVGRSGLFYESHQARWVAGRIDAATLRLEPQGALTATGESAIPNDILPLVGQQLDALGTHQLAWIAQIWPGRHIEWSLEDPAGAPVWRATLLVALPRLGEVEAHLSLGPEGLAVRFEVAAPQARAELLAGRAALARSLTAARLDVAELGVEPAHA